jgi:hypothetical protein
MKTRFIFLATLLLSLATFSNSAFAQSMRGMGMPAMGGGGGTNHSGAGGGNPGTTMGGAFSGYGGSYGGDYGGSSAVATVEGSSLTGEAALAEGLGKFNYDSARAAKQIEDARQQAIANWLLAQKAYFESRAINQAEWLAEHPRSTPAQLAQINQSRLPHRLSSSDLDPTWGVIHWPDVLQRSEFEKFREQFDDAFAHRSDERFGVGSAFYSRTQRLAHEMRASLDGQRDSMSQMEWIEAMRFIESLAYETRFAPNMTADKYTAAR